MAASVNEMDEQLYGDEGGPEESEREYRYTDEELAAAIDQEIENSITGDDTDYQLTYKEANDHYYGRSPAPVGSNTSDYVSMEVFESVESMKAKLYKTFAGARDVIRFKPMSEQDVEGARQRTAYVKRILFHENPGAALLHDLFHDISKSRLGVIKRYPKEITSYETQDFPPTPAEEIEALSAVRDDIDSIEVLDRSWQDVIVQTPLGPARDRRQMVSGRVRVRKTERKLCIEVIDPRCVHLPPGVEDLSDSSRLPSVVLSYTKRRYELLEEGYDPEKVAELDATTGTQTTYSVDEEQRPDRQTLSSLDEINIEEAYLRIDMETPKPEPEGIAQLWRIIKSGETVLLKEEVKEIPLRFATAYRVAHEALGLSPAQVAIDIQRATSNVTRGIIDNVHRVNAGLRVANMEMIRNPRDLIDNPIGGIVDAERVDAINVVPQPAISAATMPLMELLATQKEARTGDTRLGRGLNTGDVITHQNAKDMIQQLIEVGNERPMMLASLLAETCLKPLLLDIWRIGREYDIPALIEIKGQLQMVSPKQIPPGDEMQVDYALTPEYGQKRAQSTLMLHQLMTTNPVLSPLYQLEEQYAAVSEVFDLLGQPNWLAEPTDPKVIDRLQKAQQAAQQQAQMQQMLMARQMQKQEQLTDAQLMKLIAEVQKLQREPQLKKEALDLDAAQGAAKQALDEREFQHQVKVDQAEIEIERTQARQTRIGND